MTDDAPALQATLRQPNKADGSPGDPWDLTGGTVDIVIGVKNGSAAAITGSCTLLDQTTDPGGVTYNWDDVDTSVPGTYELRFKGVLASGRKFSVPNDRTGYVLEITGDPS